MPPSKAELTDQVVLDYLRSKGLTSAALEFEKSMNEEHAGSGNTASKTEKTTIEKEEEEAKAAKSFITKSTGGGYGYDKDSGWPVLHWGIHDVSKNPQNIGVQEARNYLNGLTSLQLWVLSLPEDGRQSSSNQAQNQDMIANTRKMVEDKAPIQDLIQTLHKGVQAVDAGVEHTNDVTIAQSHKYYLPPSVKPELLAVTFALLVHTYCELLEVGMEASAHSIRDAFKPVYEPLYPDEYRDLYKCSTTEEMIKLNAHNSQHLETLNHLKAILITIAQQQVKREEYVRIGNTKNLDDKQKGELERKLQEYDKHINANQQKYKEYSHKATSAFEKMHNFPFLRRARAVRWQLTLSASSYNILSSFLNSQDLSLVAMSALLQTKCELHIEYRDPVPYTPATFLESESFSDLNRTEICWAAPALQGLGSEKLPFPKFELDEEYDDEDSAKRDKQIVEFNRFLLTHGFRRLEALERKREFDALPLPKKHKYEGPPPVIRSNPLKPSIVMTTFCASSDGPTLDTTSMKNSSSATPRFDISSIWEEPGVGLCCAEMCPPDAQRIAVGCDDSAIRVWDLQKTKNGDPTQILLGHGNGFPVFDISWNRDGRTLLSAGGDGSIRLWDTLATGPYGELSLPGNKVRKTPAPISTEKKDSSQEMAEMDVPGLQNESDGFESGAAIAVYRGHTPSSIVWSVSFAPSGYYFASAGSDGSARLWTTDRPTPIRLFLGHTSDNVNCVEWHPNCNYIITGSDDKTVRLWDIHSGNCVRVLTGCAMGIHGVKISPCGRYAAAADYSGIVYLWDMSSSKLLSKFRASKDSAAGKIPSKATTLAFAFSACGKALAVGGDDCTINIWDIASESVKSKILVDTPSSSFSTIRSLVLDLQFSKRNLLMAAGKLVTPVPLIH